MVRRSLVIFAVAALFISAYGATPFAVDTAHSNIGFSVPIAGGLAQVSGKFSDFKVDLNFDETDITKSTVETTIKASSIDTGIERRDAHLRNPDFFDTEKFPEIKFKSKSIAKKGKGMTITGDFTMHGVTKEITFPFLMSGNCYDKKAQKATPPCGFNATLFLDRRDYGVSYAQKNNAEFIGNNVQVNLNLLAIAPRK